VLKGLAAFGTMNYKMGKLKSPLVLFLYSVSDNINHTVTVQSRGL